MVYMKRTLSLILVSLIMLSVACAENVCQMEYKLSIRGFILSGYYTGEVVDGIPDGYGVYETQTPDGTPCHYIGNWRNGIMHGSGAMYWNDGSLEIGKFNEGNYVSGRYNYSGLKLLIADAEGDETLNPFRVSWVGVENHKV